MPLDPLVVAAVTSLAVNYFTEFTAPTVRDLFYSVFQSHPSLQDELLAADTPSDFQKVFEEAIGVIDAQAKDGTLAVDGSLLTAMRGIRFDHGDGYVSIKNSVLRAPRISLGGAGKGETILSESDSHAEGSSISLGPGAGIKISGNGNIQQS